MTERVLVATTIGPYKMDRPDEALAWLIGAEELTGTSNAEMLVFAALEVDARGLDRYRPVLDRLDDLNGEHWTFSLDTGDSHIHGDTEREPRICLGRNLALERANRANGITHVLLLDSDIEPQRGALGRLLEVDYPVVGGHVPTYSFLTGPRVMVDKIEMFGKPLWRSAIGGRGREGILRHHEREPFPADHEMFCHWNTSGFLLLAREAFSVIRWGWDLGSGLTDDPWTQARLAERRMPTWVDYSVIGNHHPPTIYPVDARGHDLELYR
jgi:hypothetical protein